MRGVRLQHPPAHPDRRDRCRPLPGPTVAGHARRRRRTRRWGVAAPPAVRQRQSPLERVGHLVEVFKRTVEQLERVRQRECPTLDEFSADAGHGSAAAMPRAELVARLGVAAERLARVIDGYDGAQGDRAGRPHRWPAVRMAALVRRPASDRRSGPARATSDPSVSAAWPRRPRRWSTPRFASLSRNTTARPSTHSAPTAPTSALARTLLGRETLDEGDAHHAADMVRDQAPGAIARGEPDGPPVCPTEHATVR